MRYRTIILTGLVLFFGLVPLIQAEDYSLQYFLAKASSKTITLSKKERSELFNQLEKLINRAQSIRSKLIRTVHTGEADVRSQDKIFWISKLERDQATIETGVQQIKLLREKPTRLVASIKLYKSLKDLSSNFNSYNNRPSFSALVGDLAPEIELWTDPVFYKLILLPLAGSKEIGEKTSPKERKPVSRGKK